MFVRGILHIISTDSPENIFDKYIHRNMYRNMKIKSFVWFFFLAHLTVFVVALMKGLYCKPSRGDFLTSQNRLALKRVGVALPVFLTCPVKK